MKSVMKKLLGTSLCALVLMGAAVQAEAAALTDWTFTLDDVSFSDPAGKVADVFTWNDGENKNVFADYSASGSTPPILYNVMVGQGVNSYEGTQDLSLVTFNFTYTVYSATAGESFELSYAIPVRTYYDATTGKEFLYTRSEDISSTSFTHAGYVYEAADITLLQQKGASTIVGDAAVGDSGYFGWEMTNIPYFFKTSFGVMGEAALTTPPAATPEPATVLLMGLGLAGLGLAVRRRK